MDIQRFISEVNAVNWDKYEGVDYYEPEKVPETLISLAIADEETREGLYLMENVNYDEVDFLANPPIKSAVMFAIGNDHSGSYYPAVREALYFIIWVALSGNNLVAKNCAINLLIELYSFCPENDSDKDLEKFVKKTIVDTILENKENFMKLVVDDKRNKSLIENLLGIPEY